MLELLSYPPILRGLVLILISGFTLPLSGVFILRMNLLPIRYLLMHGVLLGGALALAFGWDPSLLSLGVNLLIVLVLNRTSRSLGADYGQMTMFFMVAVVAAASVIMTIFRVPAKDTLTLLWGSLYTGTVRSILAASALGIGLILFSAINFRRLTAVFHDREIARSVGIRPDRLEFVIILIIALAVAMAMRLMGALLLDALILLPAIIAGFLSTGLRRTMILSCLLGGVFSLTGFGASLVLDIPVSAGVALPAVIAFLIIILIRRSIKQ